jgi:hypothetical protein
MSGSPETQWRRQAQNREGASTCGDLSARPDSRGLRMARSAATASPCFLACPPRGRRPITGCGRTFTSRASGADDLREIHARCAEPQFAVSEDDKRCAVLLFGPLAALKTFFRTEAAPQPAVRGPAISSFLLRIPAMFQMLPSCSGRSRSARPAWWHRDRWSFTLSWRTASARGVGRLAAEFDIA